MAKLEGQAGASRLAPCDSQPWATTPFFFSSFHVQSANFSGVCSLVGCGVEVWQVRGCLSNALWLVKLRLGGALSF